MIDCSRLTIAGHVDSGINDRPDIFHVHAGPEVEVASSWAKHSRRCLKVALVANTFPLGVGQPTGVDHRVCFARIQ